MSSPGDPKPELRDNSAQQVAQGSGDQTNKSTCGVCNKAQSKYKCPRCYLPYCSVTCNKVHRENHPQDPEPKPTLPEPKAVAAPTAFAAPAVVRRADNPFHPLDSATDKLKMLFAKYPGLPQQLMEIHAATQPPPEMPENSGIPASLLKGLPNKPGSWNHDIGIKKGKEALCRARKAEGANGEAVREYCELILYLMNGQDGNDASALLQKQAATQDSELIQQLMTEEKRG